MGEAGRKNVLASFWLLERETNTDERKNEREKERMSERERKKHEGDRREWERGRES